jgi:hypothetical protein
MNLSRTVANYDADIFCLSCRRVSREYPVTLARVAKVNSAMYFATLSFSVIG